MAAKRPRERLEEPRQREKPALLLAGFMNFAIGPGDEILQVAPRFRLGGKGCDFGESGGGALVKLMKKLHLLKDIRALGSASRWFEPFLQLAPERPFIRDEPL